MHGQLENMQDRAKHKIRKKKKNEERIKKGVVHRIAFVCALASTTSGQPLTEDRHDWRAKTLDIDSQAQWLMQIASQ